MSLYFRWQQIDLELAASPEFQRDDFAVVAQTILLDVTIPLTPNGYMSTDCFHISQKGNAICKFFHRFLISSFNWSDIIKNPC